MSYATVSDIQAEFKALEISATTQITTAKVTEFLSQADARIDSYLATLYVVPITTTEALKVVKQIEIDIVASRVAKILQIKNAAILDASGVRQEILDGSSYRSAMDYLKDLQAKKAILIDAVLVSTYGSAGVSSYPTASDFECEFGRESEQW